METVNLEEIMDHVKWQLSEQIKETEAKVLVGPMPSLYGYRSSLVQLFQNLVNNALKFRGDYSPEVVIGSQTVEGGYRVMIRDNGIGINPAYQTQIFQAFKRLNQPEEYQGTGLGLAIVMKVVQQHQGKIWLDSKEGQGTTFWIEFPDLRAVSLSNQPATATQAT